MCNISKSIVLLCAFASVAVLNVSAKPADDKYTTKYDNTDVDAILKSKRLLNNYINCLLDKGSCNPDAAELKSMFITVLRFTFCLCWPDDER